VHPKPCRDASPFRPVHAKLLPPRPPVIQPAAEKGNVQSDSGEFAVLFSCLCRSLLPEPAPAAKSRTVEAEKHTGAARHGAYTTADHEFNPGMETVHRIVKNAESAALGSWESAVRPDPAGMEISFLRVPGRIARRVWGRMIDNAGGIAM
jgi:hypothetical protein